MALCTAMFLEKTIVMGAASIGLLAELFFDHPYDVLIGLPIAALLSIVSCLNGCRLCRHRCVAIVIGGWLFFVVAVLVFMYLITVFLDLVESPCANDVNCGECYCIQLRSLGAIAVVCPASAAIMFGAHRHRQTAASPELQSLPLSQVS